tara:strand:+ start:303 stop:1340 length:1038 start_codon:yes stop_codon:yes gene_type:complete
MTMNNEAQVLTLNSQEGQALLAGGSRPVVNKRTGDVMLRLGNGMTVNSTLKKDEWEELDSAVVQAATKPLNVVATLQRLGLVRRLGSIGTLTAQYNKSSEVTAANRSLTGTTGGAKDLPDYDLVGVPVPVIFKEFEIPMRTLAASRRMGDGLDLTAAVAAAKVVGESLEDLVISGDATISLNGGSISGLTSHADRNTDTATNYGGGDWGTIANVVSTISGMIAAAEGDNYFGPYALFVSTTQYGQASRSFFTDGSGDTARDRALRIPQLQLFEAAHWLADGVAVLVNLSRDVIELAYVDAYFPVVNMEWTSGDGMMTSYKVMSVATPIVKSEYSGKSGIVHCTGA